MTNLFHSDWRSLWGEEASSEPVGAIYTRPEIVELILDVAGFVADRRRLSVVRVLEPSCGDGVFLTSVLRRILESERHHCGRIDWADGSLEKALVATDISERAIEAARALVKDLLVEQGCPSLRAQSLAKTWVRQTDFLLEPWSETFGLVVGNPPYVRIEDLPRNVLQTYRAEFETLTDRADLYVAFIQRGLQLLAPEGVLAFICANRFAKNQYGSALRRFLSARFGVRVYLNLEHTQPFLSDVSAYPAILVASREQGGPTLSATLADLNTETLQRVADEVLGRIKDREVMDRFEEWYPEGAPWVTTSRQEQQSLRALATSLPVLEDSAPGTRVGIGVATGADKVFILEALHPTIEKSRQIPLAIPRDIEGSEVFWSGHFLINPFADEDTGALANLDDYQGLRTYLHGHSGQLRGRHVGKRESSWYRTIDRIWPALARTPKLLIPDIQSGCVVGFEPGELYPHHNLYFVTSTEWPLRALQAILRSTTVFKQVAAASVQMRGGTVRYQAQVLRRLRVPALRSLRPATLDTLIEAGSAADQAAVDAATAEAFAETALPVTARSTPRRKIG